MGCSQSSGPCAGAGKSANVSKQPVPEDYIILPPPSGEKIYIVFSNSVVITTYIKGDITVQNVIDFVSWKLDSYKDRLPKSLGFKDCSVTGLASVEGMQEGIMLTPSDKIIESDFWTDGERHLVAVGSEWVIMKYLDEEALMEKLEDADFWKSCDKDVIPGFLHIFWNTDVLVDQIPDHN